MPEVNWLDKKDNIWYHFRSNLKSRFSRYTINLFVPRVHNQCTIIIKVYKDDQAMIAKMQNILENHPAVVYDQTTRLWSHPSTEIIQTALRHPKPNLPLDFETIITSGQYKRSECVLPGHSEDFIANGPSAYSYVSNTSTKSLGRYSMSFEAPQKSEELPELLISTPKKISEITVSYAKFLSGNPCHKISLSSPRLPSFSVSPKTPATPTTSKEDLLAGSENSSGRPLLPSLKIK